jgi:hypothetical protein
VGWGRGEALCVHTQRNAKTAKVHSIAWHFGHEDLVKTKLLIKVCKKNMDKAFYSFLKL